MVGGFSPCGARFMVAVDELVAAGFSLPTDVGLKEVLRRFPAAPADGVSLDLIPGNKSTCQNTSRAVGELPKQSNKVDAFKVRRRIVHRQVLALLQDMEQGVDCSSTGQSIGRKWASIVRKCPGHTRRHGPCGQVSFGPFSCDFQLCPYCQHRRAQRMRSNLEELIVAGKLCDPKLITLTLPNLKHLTHGAISAMGEAFTRLLRRKAMGGVVGGVRSIEVTYNQQAKTWHLHLHALVDSSYIEHYPMTKIASVDISSEGGWKIECPETEYPRTEMHVRRSPWKKARDNWEEVTEYPSSGIEFVGWVTRGKLRGPWKVESNHHGLAWEWTEVCQNYPELASVRPDFSLDNPDHWYFVDIRVADRGAAAEVAKYIAKGVDIVAAGAGPVVDFLMAIKGLRMYQAFGSLYGLDDVIDEVTDEFGEEICDDRPLKGCCPWPDCPDRAGGNWQWVCYGYLESTLGVEHEFDPESGGYRVTVGAQIA